MQRLKLKHLDAISKEKINYSVLAKDLLKYNRWKFWQMFSFVKKMEELHKHITEVRGLDFSNLEENELCTIKRPNEIDELPLIAMLELQGLFDRDVEEIGIGELIIQTISISCFSSNSSSKFDLSSKEFIDFRHKVSESDLVYSMGLYQWINTAFNQSSQEWNKAFFEVEIINNEYDQAGGKMMEKFNVLATIKNTCQDFNMDYYSAMQIPYGIVQATGLMKATAGYIESKMSDIAEARMRTDRRNY